MITINIKDTQNPNVTGVITTDSFSSVNEAVNQIVTIAQSGPESDLGTLLKALDEEFYVVVESSFVVTIGYNFATRDLTVRLTSGEYVYENIPVSTFLQFISAESKGEFFNRNLRGRPSSK